MAIQIVDFPIKKMVIVHSYVKLPEGNRTTHGIFDRRNFTVGSTGETCLENCLQNPIIPIIIQKHAVDNPKWFKDQIIAGLSDYPSKMFPMFFCL